MPTVSYSITATADDASFVTGTLDNTGVIAGNIGGASYAGVRFLGVAVPQGATITSATLTLIVGGSFGTGTGTSLGSWKGVASDNAVAWTTTGPNTGSRTTASTTVLGSTVAETICAHTVTSIVQEIVNRAGWVSGNAMAIAGDPTGATNYCPYYDYNDNPAKVATLSITYSSGSGVTGTAAITLGALTAASAGTVAVKGVASPTLGVLVSTAAGKVAVKGISAPTLGALVSAGAGAVAVKGVASPTLGVLAVSGTGTVTAGPIAGAAAITLGGLGVSGTGAVAITGSGSVALSSLTLTGSGTVGAIGVSGAAAITLGALAVSSAGTVTGVGSLETGIFTLTGGSLVSRLWAEPGTVTVTGASVTFTRSYGVDLGELTLRLDRLQPQAKYYNADGTPGKLGQTYWQRHCEAIESAFNSLRDTVVAIQTAYNAAAQATTAAATATAAVVEVQAVSDQAAQLVEDLQNGDLNLPSITIGGTRFGNKADSLEPL